MRTLSRGFTLIELIVVIAILGILVVGIITIVNPFLQISKSRDAGRKTALKNIQTVLEQYYNDKGIYPVPASNPCTSDMTATCWNVGASSFLGANASGYIKTLPQDPTLKGTGCGAGTQTYAYYATNGGKNYLLTTSLEVTGDPSIAAGQPTAYTAAAGEPCTGHNYKLVSQQQ